MATLRPLPLKSLTENRIIREPLLVSLLFLLTLVLIGVTRAYTSAYERHREVLARQWFDQANQEVRDHRNAEAVQAFETALIYDPQNRLYLTRLAAALIASGHTTEALTYYRNLWQEDPRDGSVNLQLARAFAAQGDPVNAENYFNGAIFGNWPGDASAQRRDAAFEWINFLLQRGDKNRAKSQLLALAETLPPDPVLHNRLGDDFLKTDSPGSALEQYREALKFDPGFTPAQLSAARISFQLGDYHEAESFLAPLLREDADKDSPAVAEALRLSNTIRSAMLLDPFLSGISDQERATRVLRGFQIAGQRLQSCVLPATAGAPSSPAPSSNVAALLAKWHELSPSVTPKLLLKTPSAWLDTTNFVFSVEQQTANSCGIPSADDAALLSIARKRNGERR